MDGKVRQWAAVAVLIFGITIGVLIIKGVFPVLFGHLAHKVSP